MVCVCGGEKSEQRIADGSWEGGKIIHEVIVEIADSLSGLKKIKGGLQKFFAAYAEYKNQQQSQADPARDDNAFEEYVTQGGEQREETNAYQDDEIPF